MDIVRKAVERVYDMRRDALFERTKGDPEIAHANFIRNTQRIQYWHLTKLLFDTSENRKDPGYNISTAAGFDKNGTIPPQFLHALGYDRVVVGTVTADPYLGNTDRPRIWRFPETNSMVNFLGLPGEGVEAVIQNIYAHGSHTIPTTLSVMATPGKKGDAAIEDVVKTVHHQRGAYGIDRIQFNASCPNTPEARCELDTYLAAIKETKRNDQELELKISPDLTEGELETTLLAAEKYGVHAIVATNTTRQHNPLEIPESPGRGGASGAALYEKSKLIQKVVEQKLDEMESPMQIVAVGGIDSAQKALERTASPRVSEIEVYTGLIIKGPKLIRELRAA